MSKIFTWIIILSLTIQIGFSFYYSNEIINQNYQLDQYQTQADQFRLSIESVEKQFSDLSSISKINQSTSSASIPITQTIKIIK
jgi:thiamine biosynthesis lipoprotein ApbE